LPEALVVRLAGDPDADVRMNVSKRFVLSKDIMATLSRDPVARVREERRRAQKIHDDEIKRAARN
jgi:hypothetical protein